MEEVKKKTTTKKKEEKKVEKKTVKKAEPKKEVKTTKTATKAVKKTTKKEEPAKKTTTKKVVKKETPKKEAKKVVKEEKKTVKKAEPKKEVKATKAVKKATKKEEPTKKEVKKVEKKTVTKKAEPKKTTKGKKEENRFMPTASEWKNIEANKDAIERTQYLQQVYDTVFDHFYGKVFRGSSLTFDSNWENSKDKEILNTFAMAQTDALRMLEDEKAINGTVVSSPRTETRLPRQVEINEYDLTTEIAETLHNNWCDNEIKEFFERANVAKSNLLTRVSELSAEEILNAACYKKGKKTNEVSFDSVKVREDNAKFIESLDNFEAFKELVGKDNTYEVEVRKYAKRNIPDSQKQADFKGSTGEENILRPFEELSMVSKADTILASARAVDAYKELASAGITLDAMKNDNNARELVGRAMHVSHLKEIKDGKEYFDNVSAENKAKDLEVFDVLINIVENAREYTLYPVEGVKVPDYEQIEKDIIEGVKKPEITKTQPQVQPKSAYEVEKMIEAMEKGVDVLGEGEEERPKQNIMGYAGIWMVAISTAAITAGIFAFAAFYFR